MWPAAVMGGSRPDLELELEQLKVKKVQKGVSVNFLKKEDTLHVLNRSDSPAVAAMFPKGMEPVICRAC